MSATARERDDLDLAERVAAIEADHGLMMALVGMLSSRVAELEGEAAPLIDDEQVTTIKAAAWSTGYSQSSIRKMISSGRIIAAPIGGRVFIDKRTLPARRMRKA